MDFLVLKGETKLFHLKVQQSKHFKSPIFLYIFFGPNRFELTLSSLYQSEFEFHMLNCTFPVINTNFIICVKTDNLYIYFCRHQS
ncbi:hypothetical protein BpHYR1_025432 [Brachionus plicatilis]|uniref:Uncharacterized protein n=1 Tax=Brachionus plicatilis TaxID=10195 RepID=A0A3M7RBR3_BRAPC|nr:hypothetical protein BpHYR1_025432 [Brachionus plicatilis]